MPFASLIKTIYPLFLAIAISFASGPQKPPLASCAHILLPPEQQPTIQPTATPYAGGQRTLADIEWIFPAGWVTGLIHGSPDGPQGINLLSTSKVLDAGCSQGIFVRGLRALGVETYGIDIRSEINPNLDIHGHPLTTGLQIIRPFEGEASQYLFKADMRATPFKNGVFKVIFSTNSLYSLSYDGRNQEIVREALIENRRILEPGGYIRIADTRGPWFFPKEADPIRSVVESIPGLRITQYIFDPDKPSNRYIEIRKTN